MRKIILILNLCCFFESKAQSFSVDTALTLTQIVNQKLLSVGVVATNITYTGNAKSIGFFRVINKPSPWPVNNDSLGLDSGLFLTTGVYNDLGAGSLPVGQSTFNGPATNFQSFPNGGVGDPDLAAISGNTTTDAAILEFDFVPNGNSIAFRYVFGSEEYNDYVNSINDVFGFFVNGVSVPLLKTNIALIPNTTSPVTINSVNNGSAPGNTASAGPCVNCSYYRDNWNSMINGVYDGYTTSLTASLNVISGQTYHIKMAIADVSDRAFDSGVFLDQIKISNVSRVKIEAPNPNFIFQQDDEKKTLKIHFGDQMTTTNFKISNALLKVVESKTMQNGQVEFDLSQLSPGLYSIVYNYNSRQFAKKIIVP